MPIQLSDNDKALVANVHSAIRAALVEANAPIAVVKRLTSIIVNYRNQGRDAAIRRYPFQGICEASGLPLDERDKVLDEMDSEIGYTGRIRWVCPKENNSGPRSCGGC